MLVIGLISGTSMDAIDAALVELKHDGPVLNMRLRAFTMLPYDPALRARLVELLPPLQGSTAAVCELNVQVAEVFADAVEHLAAQANLSLDQIDLIASHGQTVYHQVAPGQVRSTLQLGTPAVFAERIGCTVVSDFRPRDIAAGGQGAPLVPYLDVLLFKHPQRNRVLQNIGGIGNLTYLPTNGEPFSFDTGPGNVLIDEAMRLISNGSQTFDKNGELAATGEVNLALVEEWMRHPYFQLEPPRSTGRELFGVAEAQQYVAQCHAHGLSTADTIATITALTAHSIADSYRRWCGPIDEALISGGGARNATLLRMLQSLLPEISVQTVDALALDADAKEAVAFAVAGYAALHGWPNNIPAATGASRPVVLGNITPGNNYRALLQRVLSSSAEPVQRIELHA